MFSSDLHDNNVDAIWVHIDPVVMNQKSFDFLKERSLATGLPLLTSLSDKFAEAGALVSVSVDFTAIGSQAATIVEMFMQDGSVPKAHRIQPPVGGKLSVNLEVAKQLGITIPAESYANINRIIIAD